MKFEFPEILQLGPEGCVKNSALKSLLLDSKPNLTMNPQLDGKFSVPSLPACQYHPFFSSAIDALSVELKPDGRPWGHQMFSTAFCSVAASTLFANAVTSAFFAKLLFCLCQIASLLNELSFPYHSILLSQPLANIQQQAELLLHTRRSKRFARNA